MAVYLPCRNPNCKSNGQSHPNCHCYDNTGLSALQSLESLGYETPGVYKGKQKKMADGGEVHFCSEDRPHKPDCQYYVDGGDVTPDFVPDAQFTPDAVESKASGDFIPDSEFKPDSEKTASSDFIPDNEFVSDQDKYSTPGQQALTMLEGGAQGFAGPVATGTELVLSKMGVPGLTAQDIAARAAANPWEHGTAEAAGLGAGLYTGVGELGLVAKGAARLLPEAGYATKLAMRGQEILSRTETVPILQRIGTNALKGFIETGAIQGGDEISRAMLGQGDPEAPVSSAIAHIGASGLFGAVTGGVFSGLGIAATKGLAKINEEKFIENAMNFMTGMGAASADLKEVPWKTDAAFKSGMKFYNEGMKKIITTPTKLAADFAGATIGGNVAGPAGAAVGAATAHKVLGPHIESIIGPIARRIGQKTIVPATLYALSHGYAMAIPELIQYSRAIAKGQSAIGEGVDALFKASGQQAIDATVSNIDREKIKEFLEQGGVNQQMQNQMQHDTQASGYAEGGTIENPTPEVSDSSNHLGMIYPEQNTLLHAAKGRVYNYLNSLRPQEIQQKLPFDKQMPNIEQERKYDRAVDLAAKPLGILNKIKDGSLTTEHMQHFQNMWPELNSHLQKRMTERMTQAQLNEEKPPAKVRNAMSLFMGSPLESITTQQSIAAAQAVFMGQKMAQAQQNPTKNVRKTSSLGKMSENHQTDDEARIQRMNKA